MSKYISVIVVIGLLFASPVQGEKKPFLKYKILTSSQIMKVCGEAGLVSENYYGGDLYNGNRDIFITEISVYVSAKKMGAVFPRIYLCKVNIAPLTSVSFGFNIAVGDQDSDYSWGIIEAKGYEAN
jgi:hypothetical protein